MDDGFRVFRWAHDPYKGSSENAYHRWLQASHPDLYAAAARGDDGELDLGHDAHRGPLQPVDRQRDHRLPHELARPGQAVLLRRELLRPAPRVRRAAEYVDRYDPAALPRPVTTEGELATKPPVFEEASKRSYAGHARGFVEYTEDELQEVSAAYYAMVTLVDDEVGRILDALDAQGLADDTIVVFTSDHGEMLGDHQLMLKGPFMYDCAVRVPLIVRWPGHLERGRRSELVQWVDLAPTFLEAAGVPAPSHVPGQQPAAAAVR